MLVVSIVCEVAEAVLRPFDMGKPLVGNYITVCTMCLLRRMRILFIFLLLVSSFTPFRTMLDCVRACFLLCAFGMRVGSEAVQRQLCNYFHHNHSNSGIISLAHYTYTHVSKSWYMDINGPWLHSIDFQIVLSLRIPTVYSSWLGRSLACYNVNLLENSLTIIAKCFSHVFDRRHVDCP